MQLLGDWRLSPRLHRTMARPLICKLAAPLRVLVVNENSAANDEYQGSSISIVDASDSHSRLCVTEELGT